MLMIRKIYILSKFLYKRHLRGKVSDESYPCLSDWIIVNYFLFLTCIFHILQLIYPSLEQLGDKRNIKTKCKGSHWSEIVS